MCYQINRKRQNKRFYTNIRCIISQKSPISSKAAMNVFIISCVKRTSKCLSNATSIV